MSTCEVFDTHFATTYATAAAATEEGRRRSTIIIISFFVCNYIDRSINNSSRVLAPVQRSSVRPRATTASAIPPKKYRKIIAEI